MSTRPPWEPGGLQNERTTLAWFRTAMAFLVVSAFAARQSPSGAVAVLLLGVLLAVAVMVTLVDRRHRVRARDLAAGNRVTALPGVATTSAVVVVLAAWSLAVVAG